MWNWIKLTPLVVTPSNFLIIFTITIVTLIAAHIICALSSFHHQLWRKLEDEDKLWRVESFKLNCKHKSLVTRPDTTSTAWQATSHFDRQKLQFQWETTLPTHHQLQNMLVAESHFLQSIQRAVVNKFQYWLNLWEKARPAKSVRWFFKSTSESMMDRWVGHWTVDRGMGAG